jgi:Tat protein secretion system quality control protein TatD with DNase activity
LGENEVDTELRFIKHNISRVVALGEIGLDYDKNIVKTTSKALIRGLQQAFQFNLD